jgi:hypothetical protein
MGVVFKAEDQRLGRLVAMNERLAERDRIPDFGEGSLRW